MRFAAADGAAAATTAEAAHFACTDHFATHTLARHLGQQQAQVGRGGEDTGESGGGLGYWCDAGVREAGLP